MPGSNWRISYLFQARRTAFDRMGREGEKDVTPMGCAPRPMSPPSHPRLGKRNLREYGIRNSAAGRKALFCCFLRAAESARCHARSKQIAKRVLRAHSVVA